MKLMKLAEWNCSGEGKTIYLNPASIICIYPGEEGGAYVTYSYGEYAFSHVIGTVEEVSRIWEEAING